MPITDNSKYRIKRSKLYDKQMTKMRQLKVFAGYPSLLMYSLILGFLNDKYSPFSAQAEGVQTTFFQDADKDIFDFIVYLRTGQAPLTDKLGEEKYSIVEAYINGGFPILRTKLGLDDIESMVIDDALDKVVAERLLKMLLTRDFYDNE